MRRGPRALRIPIYVHSFALCQCRHIVCVRKIKIWERKKKGEDRRSTRIRRTEGFVEKSNVWRKNWNDRRKIVVSREPNLFY